MASERLTDERIAELLELANYEAYRGAHTVSWYTQCGPVLVRSLLSEIVELREHMARHFPARGSTIGDLTALEEWKEDCEFWRSEALKAESELRDQRRATDSHRVQLSEEEREALRWPSTRPWLLTLTKTTHLGPPVASAIAVLDRLIGAKP